MDKEVVEKHNVETFEKYGTDNGSASNRGHKLLCMICFHKKFEENENFMKEFYGW